MLIITGAGESAFVSGADINDIRARGRDEGLAAINSSLFAEIERFPAPDDRRDQRLRARRRMRAGAGLRHPDRVRDREVRSAGAWPRDHSRAPAPPSVCRVSSGLGWAKHLVLTGDVIDAKQALDIGLVTAVTPRGSAADSRARAGQACAAAGAAGRAAGQARARTRRLALIWTPGLLIETLAQAICYSSDDKAEGTAAFLEKRKPRFSGR